MHPHLGNATETAPGLDACHGRSWRSYRYGLQDLWNRVPPLLGIHHNSVLSGGNSKIFVCSSRKLGKWSNLTSIFFQMGWFNHQLGVVTMRKSALKFWEVASPLVMFFFQFFTVVSSDYGKPRIHWFVGSVLFVCVVLFWRGVRKSFFDDDDDDDGYDSLLLLLLLSLLFMHIPDHIPVNNHGIMAMDKKSMFGRNVDTPKWSMFRPDIAI